jgi:hypothetical protein
MTLKMSGGIVSIIGGAIAFGFWMHNWVAGVFMVCTLTIFDSMKHESPSGS